MKIIKYNNRRLYCEKRGYITFDDVVEAVRGRATIEVRWHNGHDITREILMQVLGHVELRREQPKLSVAKLCELIRE